MTARELDQDLIDHACRQLGKIARQRVRAGMGPASAARTAIRETQSLFPHDWHFGVQGDDSEEAVEVWEVEHKHPQPIARITREPESEKSVKLTENQRDALGMAYTTSEQARHLVHWIVFDPANLAKANRSLRAGSRYLVRRIYNHPTKAWLTVLQVESPDAYADLKLDVNSGSSTLRRLSRKPGNLGPGMSVESFERIYGPLEAPR